MQRMRWSDLDCVAPHALGYACAHLADHLFDPDHVARLDDGDVGVCWTAAVHVR